MRAEGAERTRRKLLEAAEALLLELPVEEVSIPKVAERAGVAAPTAYRHFPTNEDLLRGFLDHLRPRIGMTLADIAAVRPEQVHELAPANYRRYERESTLLRRMMDSPRYDRVRLDPPVDRAAVVLPAWQRSEGERLDTRKLRSALGAVYLLITPVAWRWLRDTWGLSALDAARGASWAIGVLARELAKASTLDDSTIAASDEKED